MTEPIIVAVRPGWSPAHRLAAFVAAWRRAFGSLAAPAATTIAVIEQPGDVTMNPQVLQILAALVAAGPGVSQAIIALIQALAQQRPANTAAIHQAIKDTVAQHEASA